VLDKYGKPDDALPGVKNSKEPLPHFPLTGMYNKAGGKVRLTFKLELDQLWLGTKGNLYFMFTCACYFQERHLKYNSLWNMTLVGQYIDTETSTIDHMFLHYDT
jgi:hypothetical protein